jgi:hypothetical protein
LVAQCLLNAHSSIPFTIQHHATAGHRAAAEDKEFMRSMIMRFALLLDER